VTREERKGEGVSPIVFSDFLFVAQEIIGACASSEDEEKN
jgi:hypothetical protein